MSLHDPPTRTRKSAEERREEIVALAMAGNVGLAGIDIVYVARRVILPIYLLDAVIEVLLFAAWTWVERRRGRPRQARGEPRPKSR